MTMDAKHGRLLCMLEFSLQVHYAKAIVDKLEKTARLLCRGCRQGYLSQRDHSCMMMDRESKLYYLIWDVTETLDDDKIIENWYDSQKCTDIDRAVLDLHMLTLKCKDYRETRMKTEQWRKNVSRIAQTILRLENVQ